MRALGSHTTIVDSFHLVLRSALGRLRGVASIYFKFLRFRVVLPLVILFLDTGCDAECASRPG